MIQPRERVEGDVSPPVDELACSDLASWFATECDGVWEQVSIVESAVDERPKLDDRSSSERRSLRSD